MRARRCPGPGLIHGGRPSQGAYDVTASFAVPFEEDERDPSIWFLDHNFLENMHGMFKKVNAREKIIGWYSTGPRIRPGVRRSTGGIRDLGEVCLTRAPHLCRTSTLTSSCGATRRRRHT